MKKKGSGVSIGAAMADLALLLLIFFMATTSIIPEKIAGVDLPSADADGIDQNNIYITIKLDGSIVVDDNKISLEELDDLLFSRGAEVEKKIAITADKNLPYKKIQEVLDVVSTNDFLKIVFLAQPKQE